MTGCKIMFSNIFITVIPLLVAVHALMCDQILSTFNILSTRIFLLNFSPVVRGATLRLAGYFVMCGW